jgi:hypothetical protein
MPAEWITFGAMINTRSDALALPKEELTRDIVQIEGGEAFGSFA